MMPVRWPTIVASIVLALAGCGGSASAPDHATMTDLNVGRSSVDFVFDTRVQQVVAAYAHAPIAECGSGAPVRPSGAAVLVVHFLPAQTRGLPKRVVMPSGTVRELWKVCDFEADVGWAIAVSRLAPFDVSRDGTTVTVTFGG
jgi:hypothetical protein